MGVIAEVVVEAEGLSSTTTPPSATTTTTSPPTLVSGTTKKRGKRKSLSSQQAQQSQKLVSAVEFEPPVACVRRILKRSLPSSTNVGKDACAAFARACGIFIIYITACSHDFARENKRQTITANDVLAACKVR
jgi:histone H3/H4